jgi:hypothetical protein
MEMKEVSEKQWQTNVRAKLATQLKVEPAELRFSPSKRLIACVRDVTPQPRKPPRHPPPRRFQIVVVDPEGARRAQFTPVTAHGSDEPPKDFHFLAEDRLVYEVVQPPPPPPPAPKKRSRHAKPPRTPVPPKTDPPPPHRLFIVQPIERRQRRLRCEGIHFTFTAQHDHFAFVGGKPQSAFVSVDGTQVYPRRGHTIVAGELAWSKDGRSLAFLETPPSAKPRLVLLAEYDNPTGDTTWDLPPAASVDGARVFWGGSSKLVVAKTPTKPLFSASFTKEKPPAGTGEKFKNAGP